jgi:acyl-coenzyme A thioesterase PaaI-like protein
VTPNSSTLQFIREQIQNKIPVSLRETARLRLFGLLKIPVIFFVSPKVIEISDERCVIRIPLNRRTRNHYRSMYFGVMAAGADLGAGLLAQYLSEKQAEKQTGGKIGILFKDFKADFLKRAEDDTEFVCEEGEAIQKAIETALSTGERQNIPVRVYATVPKRSGTEPVAEFVLTLSLKKKS